MTSRDIDDLIDKQLESNSIQDAIEVLAGHNMVFTKPTWAQPREEIYNLNSDLTAVFSGKAIILIRQALGV